MKTFALALIILLYTSNTFANTAEQTKNEPAKSDTQIINRNTPNENNNAEEEIAKRGCCSHHKGVCGCDGKRQLCCDGKLSPSCKCEDGEPL